jgi:hypothetical protein
LTTVLAAMTVSITTGGNTRAHSECPAAGKRAYGLGTSGMRAL